MSSFIINACRHFNTITKHRHKVIQHCFKAGILWQGCLHDLSKYSFHEFIVGAKYYQVTRSPNEAEREAKGYSSAWTGMNIMIRMATIDRAANQAMGRPPGIL